MKMASLRARNQRPTSGSLFSCCVVRRRHLKPVETSRYRLLASGPKVQPPNLTVEPYLVHLPRRIVLRGFPSCADLTLALC
jgi:hypothetical protein